MTTRPRLTYLASPYSHPDPAVREQRYHAAVAAAAHLMRAGRVVFSPIAHSHEIGRVLAAENGGTENDDVHAFWMGQDLPVLARCDELVVAMLPGWWASRGVAQEIAEARRLGLPVLGMETLTGSVVTLQDLVDAAPFLGPATDAIAADAVRAAGDQAPPAAAAGAKDTNPKDAIGTRKAPMSTVPAGVLLEIGVGMLEGAAKGYGRHNYRIAGVRASVYYDAALRHLFAWWEGEDLDPDSEVSHIAKALCTLVVLRDAMHQDRWIDDRAPRSRPFVAELNARAAALIDQHANKSPRHYTIADSSEARG